MDPVTAMTLAQTAFATGQGVVGALRKGKSRPKKTIPSGITEAESYARIDANATVRPGGDLATDNLKAGQSATVAGAKQTTGSGTQLMAALS